MARTIPRAAAERSNRLLLIGALLFAGVAAILVFALLINLGGGRQSTGSAPGGTPVVVAARDIAAGERITAEMVELKEVAQPLRGRFEDMDKVVGKAAVSFVQKGDQITVAKVGEAPADDTLASLVPRGYVAATVEVDEQASVGGLLKPSDVVDVLLVLEGDKETQPQAFIIMETIQVLCIGQDCARPAPQTDEEGEDSGRQVGSLQTGEDVDPNPEAKTVTLAVDRFQAKCLAAAQEAGRISLALHRYNDLGANGVDSWC